MRVVVQAILASFLIATSVAAGQMPSSIGTLRVEKIAGNLPEPWALAFLPDGGFLVTLRDGEMRHYRANGEFVTLSGVPKPHVQGQGGLLDVVVLRDFEASREIAFTYSYRNRLLRRQGTAVAVARLSADGTELENIRTVFQMQPGSRGPVHYGSRIVEAPDGRLFVTLGDRGIAEWAQMPDSHNGSVIAINRDGTPAGAGFAGLPEIWSIGHRNPQGAALDPKGRLFVVEHGAQGGDEVNLIRPGVNYGWPVISYGKNYDNSKIGTGTHKQGLEQPKWYWDPSIAPSGMAIYDGDLFPAWRGDFFVGSLKYDMISRLRWQGGTLVEVERLSAPETGRIRDIRQAPDGSLWFLSVYEEAVFRIVPDR